MYNILSNKIGLSSATLASFYCHQKIPSMDKLIPWIEKEGKRIVSFASSNSSSSSVNNGSGKKLPSYGLGAGRKQ